MSSCFHFFSESESFILIPKSLKLHFPFDSQLNAITHLVMKQPKGLTKSIYFYGYFPGLFRGAAITNGARSHNEVSYLCNHIACA